MNQYAKIQDNKVENIIVSDVHPEPSSEYVRVYDNSSLIAIGYEYQSGVGFTPFKGDVVSEADLQKNISPVDSTITIEQRKIKSREFRDNILKETDWIMAATDHPQFEAYRDYRQRLRDWPESSDFPSGIPQL